MTKPRVLVTGAAGFLGSHLCDRFLKEEFEVIGMDNLITGDIKNIENAFRSKEFTFYEHDVTKFVHVPGKLDYIIYSDSVIKPGNHFVLFTPEMSADSLAHYGLKSRDVVQASDHLPVLGDFILPVFSELE